MKKVFVILFLLIVNYVTSQNIIKRDTILMGSTFNFTISTNNSINGDELINKAIDEVVRIEYLISEWISSSQVSKINQNAGLNPVKVDLELFNLTKRALFFSDLTDGAFDISIISMDKIWKFDGSMSTLPTTIQLKEALKYVNYKDIVLSEKDTTIFLKHKGMKIGFGATGKGYAADQAQNVLQKLGVESGIVNASGDLAVWSSEIEPQKTWKIGVKNPYKSITEIYEVTDISMATSGNYEKFAEIDNKRYAHIINPKTGYPSNELTSATVIGPSAEWANGLSTSIMVLGSKKGLKLLQDFPDYTAVLIKNNGKFKKAKNFKKFKHLYFK